MCRNGKDFKRSAYHDMYLILPLITVYYAFRLEIANYWDQLEADSALTISDASGSVRYFGMKTRAGFKSIWIINYSLLLLRCLLS